MRKNPYLAHYFGDALESRLEEEKHNAAENVAYFRHFNHMTQREFCPLKKPELTTDATTPHCISPSNPTPPLQIPASSFQEGFQVSPMGLAVLSGCWNRIPPLSPPISKRSTPVDMPAVVPPDSPVGCTNKKQLDLMPLALPRDMPRWSEMISRSHAVIANAKEILDAENNPSPPVVPVSDTSDGMAVVSVATYPPQSSLVRNDISDADQRPKESTPGSQLAVASQLEGKDNLVSSPVSSRRLSCSIESVQPSLEGLQEQQKEQQQRYIKEPEQRPSLVELVETKCIILRMNPNAAACAAKRLTRRQQHTSVTPKGRNAVVVAEEEDVSAPQTIDPRASALKVPASHPKGRVRRLKLKGDGHKDDTISVASLYGILDRLADVMHPRHGGTGVSADVGSEDSKSKKPSMDASRESKRDSDTPTHINIDRVMNLRKEKMKKRHVPSPKVVVGNAPRMGSNEAPMNSHRYEPNNTVPTSQLPEVGLGLRRTSFQRTPSTRRSSVSRAMKTPSYALPTECWLYKGAELGDANEDMGNLIDKTRRRQHQTDLSWDVV